MVKTCVAAALIAAAVALAIPSGAKAQEKPVPELSSVLGELRKGGLVIYFRHGATEATGPSDTTTDLSRCETQRNLSAEGRAQATRIGTAFRVLGIPVGAVESSPFCRCKDTAQLAFGRYTVNNVLFFAINVSADERKQLAESLRRMLATPPAPGTNTVIVSHTANLQEAAGIWPKPEGVAYIFRPLPDGRFEVVARAIPEDWVRATKPKAAASG
jgi:phosphohistidine phosphatase SixA